MRILTTLILLTTFFSCDTQPKQKLVSENIQQDSFLQFLKASCASYNGKTNDIQKGEYLKEYEKKLLTYVDSVGVIQNWKGIIKDIRSTNWDSYNAVEFKTEIKIALSDYQDLTFETSKFISNKEKDSSLVYQQLKNLAVGTTVYFSGIISKNDENNIDFGLSLSLNEGDKICDPEIKFHLAYITKDKDEIKISKNISDAIQIQNSVWKTMDDRVNKKLNEKAFKSKLQEYKISLDKIFPLLTETEKNYIKALTQSFADQFRK